MGKCKSLTLTRRSEVKAYKGKFYKKDGTLREIKFVRTSDLTEEFIKQKIKNNSKTTIRTLEEGMELVWEIENGWRYFNNKTIVGSLEEFEIEILTE
jgi:hypothetical protein